MLGAPVKDHVLAADGNAQQSGLFAEGKEYPRQLTNPAAMIGLRSKSFRLGPHQSHELKYAIAFGKTADEAIENARNALAIAPEDAAARLDAYWDARLPALTTGNPGLTSMLRYAGITHDVNWEPDGRAPGDLGGWGRPSRAEVCGYKYPDHLCLSGNLCAITAGLADEAQTAAICEEVSALYTGSGFPNVHPPLPRWVGSAPYGYQNGDMYIDQLALVARAANKARDTDLLRHVLFEFKRLVQRHKCFPVTGHPWDANRRGGVNEIHSASALIASLVYGVAGVEEQRSLRLRPMLIPEMGGSVQISDYLFRGTRFDIRLEGAGTHVHGILVDGKKQEKAVVPEEYYDGTKHTVTVRVKE